MKIKAYLCCDESGCEAKELAEICIGFEGERLIIENDCPTPDGWQRIPSCMGYTRYDRTPETYYCPLHKRRQ